MPRKADRALAGVLGALTLVAMAACGDDDDGGDLTDNAGVSEQQADDDVSGAPGSTVRGLQDIPVFTGVDAGVLGEPVYESVDLGMAGGVGLDIAELDGRPVALTGTRTGEVVATDLATGDSAGTVFTGHDGAIRDVHVADVDGVTTVVSVEVGLANVWDLDTGELIGELDLGSDYDFTMVIEYDGRPVFVNGTKDIVLTDLATLETVEHYTYDIGMASYNANVIDLNGSTVLVADNVVGGEYGIGVWDLADGSAVYDYPLYLHDDRSVNEMASGYLGDTVLTLTGDFGGQVIAWDMSRNIEYGPAISIDGSSVTALTVVELDGTLVGAAATLDRSMMFWDVATGEVVKEMDAPGLGVDHFEVADLDGRPVLVASGEGEMTAFWLG